MIEADGRHLWRVLENLYNNAFKYAMENSRVYTEVTSEDGMVWFTIKNVSEHPLNISPDELTERFVRGDVSRTTEGSGLGLSIAQSLTKLQGGTFEVIIDGDLFKARVGFALIEA
jgi:signal transduction histidine kinase